MQRHGKPFSLLVIDCYKTTFTGKYPIRSQQFFARIKYCTTTALNVMADAIASIIEKYMLQ